MKFNKNYLYFKELIQRPPEININILENLCLKQNYLRKIKIDNEWFKDEYGRTLILRGVNIGSKTPIQSKSTLYRKNNFFDHKTISFVGRPFSIDEMDEHFTRLSHLGFTFLRFLINWESIEHSGPGEYDEDYLNYLYTIVKRAGDYGINLFIDFHQDVWSRYSGGDGAPGWTLDEIGFNLENLEETGACVLETIKNKNISHFIWFTNMQKLAAATMSTVFFGGDIFAPKTKINGISAKQFLQNHFMYSVLKVVKKLKPLKNVIGFDLINEPFPGYIEYNNLSEIAGKLKIGYATTPFQSMILGDGHSIQVDVFEKKFLNIEKTGEKNLNLYKKRAWKKNQNCIWYDHGIWDKDSKGNPVLNKPNYFKNINGEKVNFHNDFYKPFVNNLSKEIHSIKPEFIIFIENVINTNESIPSINKWDDFYKKNTAMSVHWYDAITLVTKRFWSFLGFNMLTMKVKLSFPKYIIKSFVSQIKKISKLYKTMPTIISEFGIPFDLNNKKSYKNNNFKHQIKAFDRSFKAMDSNVMSCIIWNYNSDNSNLNGDKWNGEDMSIFSEDQRKNPYNVYSGIRAAEAVIRPYAMRTAGTPIFMNFNIKKGIFKYIFKHDSKIKKETEIFLPNFHFSKGFIVKISDGTYKFDPKNQILKYYHCEQKEQHVIKIRKL